MRAPVILALLASLTTAGAAAAPRGQSGEAELAGVIGNRVPGKPVTCIDPHDLSSVQVIDGTAIVYGVGTRIFVNRPQAGAASLRRDDVLVSRIDGGQLCRVDTITLLDSASRMERGFVVLGSFVPYNRPRG